MTYSCQIEKLEEKLEELLPLYRRHYSELQARLAGLGIPTADFNPQWETYFSYERLGLFFTFIVRCDGEAVGYANIYVTPDMHNGEKIASEDTLYVLPEHRGKSAGKDIVDFAHKTLREQGVKRLNIITSTDLKVAAWLEKRGYKHTAHAMTICFD